MSSRGREPSELMSIANRISCLCIAGALTAAPSGCFAATADAPNPPSSQRANGSATYTDLGYGSYPRVTELEQQFLGKTYESEPLPTRVARLETKKFGKASTGDLCDRIDKLDRFAQPKPPPPESDVPDGDGGQPPPNQAGAGGTNFQANMANMQPSMSGSQGSEGGDSDARAENSSGDYGNYPKVTALEQEFLGKTFVVDPLPARLSRLETKEFGKTSPDDALCDRMDRLEKRSSKPKQVADDDSNDNGHSGSGSGKSSMGGTIGKAFMSLLGGGGGGGGGGVGMGGMGMGGLPFGMMGGRGMGMGGMGMGGGGMGMGGGGMGGGGRGGRQSNQNAAPAPAPVQNPFLPGADQVEGVEARSAVMEKFVFGHGLPHATVEDRVQRLEKKLVPYEHHDSSQDLAKRVDHLWSMLSAANKQQGKRDVAANDATLR
jgi:hypothetical protein